MKSTLQKPPFARSLSAKLLLLTIIFVMLAEVAIYLPSVAGFRADWLRERLAAGHLAALSVVAAPEGMVTKELEAELLRHVGAYAVDVVLSSQRVLMLMTPESRQAHARFDLGTDGFARLVLDSLALLNVDGDRIIAVTGPSPKDPAVTVSVLIDEAPLRAATWDFTRQLLLVSVVISLFTAGLVYLAILFLTVRPMQVLVAAMMRFKQDPDSEAPSQALASVRRDEVGIAQRELIAMQAAVRQALRQRSRLATLGTAVAKINHDLRGILALATLWTESLPDSPDPAVRRAGGRILSALERAAMLCGQTLDFTRDGVMPLSRGPLLLRDLVEEAGMEALAERRLEGAPPTILLNQIPAGLVVEADADQLIRAVGNLLRNAAEAGAAHVSVSLADGSEMVTLIVGDDGPGLAPRAREHLFQPFAGSTRAHGSGLGLAIAREVMRAHGGDLRLLESTGAGTRFAASLGPGAMIRQETGNAMESRTV